MTDSLFPIIDQLLAAATQQERAAQLLRLPDGLVHTRGWDLITTCRSVGFAAGAAYVLTRLTCVMAVRDGHGLVPERMAGEAEAWRVAISDFAAGKGEGFPVGK